jgi:hypothetical protein
MAGPRSPRNGDDDMLNGEIPAPDAEASPAERAHARTFAELIDKTMAGRTPAAMSTDDRALLEVATVIRATAGALSLGAARQRSVVEDALRQAIGGEPAASRRLAATHEPTRVRRWAPWLVSATTSLVALAAIAMLWLRPAHRVAPSAAAARKLPISWTSRPSDPLIGPIAAEHAGDASARLDYIFADRMDGYRERRLARGGLP